MQVRTVLGAAVLAALIVLLPARAMADWDVQTFVKLRDEAQQLYDRDDFDDALPRYRVLESMIRAALDADEIPPSQQQAAREALEVVRYQVGRSQQGLDDCASALATYLALATDAATEVIQVRVAARIPETRLCLAAHALARDDAETALRHARDAARNVAVLPDPAPLASEDAALLAEVSDAAATTLADLHEQVLHLRTEAARAELKAQRCEPARAAVERVRELAIESDTLQHADQLAHDTEALCQALAARAEADAAAAAAATATARTDPGLDLPPGPLVLLAVGAATLVADAVFEGVVAADHLDQLERARSDCRTSGLRCDQVLSLTDSIETDQAVSIALLAGGGALLIGGATWWILDATLADDADPGSTATGFLAPRPGGALVGLTLRLD